jgi:hypothetical protein
VTKPGSSTTTSVTFSEDLDGQNGVEPRLEERVAYFTNDIITINARGFDGLDEFELGVENNGPTRRIDEVEVHHITSHNTKIAVVAGTSLTATELVDGPNQVEEIEVSNGGSSTTSNLNNPAVENRRPQATLSSISLPGDGATSTITFQLDSGYQYTDTNGEDALSARITLYFDDGTKKTFDVMLQSSDDS